MIQVFTPACSLEMTLPPKAYGDRPEIRADVIVLALHETEFAIELKLRRNLAGNAASEVGAELVLTGVQKIAIYRQSIVEAFSPPLEKTVAGRSRNGTRRVEFSRAVQEGQAADYISAPLLSHGNVNDGAEHQRVGMTIRAWRLC